MSKIVDYSDIFDYITTQEIVYKNPIQLNDAWSWGMMKHIKTSFNYAHSQLAEREKGPFDPVKNITRPILNLQHRTEDIEVKDVQIYIDDPSKYHLSFLVKKYYDDVFVVENDLDTYFDELNISRIDYGGGLSKKLNSPCPEVVPLQSVVFCDQSDLLSGPIGLKHYYSPDQLLEMGSKGWGDEKNGATMSLKDLISLSREEKKSNENGTITKTPGRYIEIYEVHGNLPKKFADKNDTSGEYETRMFICAFYQKPTGTESQGVILYTAPETESPFKLTKRDPVHGRALGFGGAEELFEAQIWVNYDMIRMQRMLESASITILGATGPNSTTIAQKSRVHDMENNEIVDLGDSDLKQIDTFPRNFKLFENSVSQWEAHGQQMGAANDSIMGAPPTAGTPFKLQELVTQESHGLHEYRRGQYAKHLEEIHKDWIIPDIQKEICKGATFLSELSLEELTFVSESIATSQTNKRAKEMLLKGEVPTQEALDLVKQTVLDSFKKKGTKHFIKILKDEFKNTKLGVKVSVAGKSKNLATLTDKITNIFRFAFSNPQGFAQVMQIPGMGKAFNEILEYSGLSPVDFSGIDKMATAQPNTPPTSTPEPTQELAAA